MFIFTVTTITDTVTQVRFFDTCPIVVTFPLMFLTMMILAFFRFVGTGRTITYSVTFFPLINAFLVWAFDFLFSFTTSGWFVIAIRTIRIFVAYPMYVDTSLIVPAQVSRTRGGTRWSRDRGGRCHRSTTTNAVKSKAWFTIPCPYEKLDTSCRYWGFKSDMMKVVMGIVSCKYHFFFPILCLVSFPGHTVLTVQKFE